MSDKRRVVVHAAFHRQDVYTGGRSQMDNPKWWQRRAEIFRDWTLASLRNQSCQDFDIVVTMRPIDITPTNPLLKVCDEAGVVLLVRKEVGKPWKYPLAPCHHGWLCTLYQDLDWLIMLGVDSDDCYASDVVKKLYAEPMSEGLILHFDFGYEYGVFDHKMAWYGQPKGPGPFFAKCYSQQAMQSARVFGDYRKRWGFECFHYQTASSPNNRPMPPGLILQTFHDQNASSHWENQFVKRRIKHWITDEAKKAKILETFGRRT